MGLRIITEPSHEPLSVSELRSHARVDDNEEDQLLLSYLRASREQAETFTRRQFISATYELTLDKFPSGYIELPKPPVSSVSSITYLDANDVEQTLSTSVYDVDSTIEPACVYLKSSQVWPGTNGQRNSVKVTFVAGYGNSSAVPESIKQAIRFLVTHFIENRSAVEIVEGGRLEMIPKAFEMLLWRNRIIGVS